MPSTYAHYRFGVGLLPTMPGDVRRTIQRFRRLFDVGLHGPDIFYYQSALSKAASRFLGVKYHEQTGKDFFSGSVGLSGWSVPKRRRRTCMVYCAITAWIPRCTPS